MRIGCSRDGKQFISILKFVYHLNAAKSRRQLKIEDT